MEEWWRKNGEQVEGEGKGRTGMACCYTKVKEDEARGGFSHDRSRSRAA